MMKLVCRIDHYKVLTTIDSGASHYFISEKVVRQLGLTGDQTNSFSVIPGNGQRVSAVERCRAAYLSALSYLPSGLLCISAGGVDLIQGISYLAQLSDVKANWKNLTMKFAVEGRHIMLHGDPAFDHRVVPAAHVYCLSDAEQSWLLSSLEQNPAVHGSSFSVEFSVPQAQGLAAVLRTYSAVLAPPTGLPPRRNVDHQINCSWVLGQFLFVLTATITLRRMRWNGWWRRC